MEATPTGAGTSHAGAAFRCAASTWLRRRRSRGADWLRCPARGRRSQRWREVAAARSHATPSPRLAAATWCGASRRGVGHPPDRRTAACQEQALSPRHAPSASAAGASREAARSTRSSAAARRSAASSASSPRLRDGDVAAEADPHQPTPADDGRAAGRRHPLPRAGARAALCCRPRIDDRDHHSRAGSPAARSPRRAAAAFIGASRPARAGRARPRRSCNPCGAAASDAQVPFAALARWLRNARPTGDARRCRPGLRAELARLLPSSARPAKRRPGPAAPALCTRRPAWPGIHGCGMSGVPAFDDWQFVDAASASGGAGGAIRSRAWSSSACDPAAPRRGCRGPCRHPRRARFDLDRPRAARRGGDARAGAGPFRQRARRTLRAPAWRATGGNPLFAFETPAHLVETRCVRRRRQRPLGDAPSTTLPRTIASCRFRRRCRHAARLRAVRGPSARRRSGCSKRLASIGDDFDLAHSHQRLLAPGEWEELRSARGGAGGTPSRAPRRCRRRPVPLRTRPGGADAAGGDGAGAAGRWSTAPWSGFAGAARRAGCAHRRPRRGRRRSRAGPVAGASLALDAARRRFALGDVLTEAGARAGALDPSPAQAIAAHSRALPCALAPACRDRTAPTPPSPRRHGCLAAADSVSPQVSP